MDLLTILLLVAAAMIAGGINSVAGGGSFLTFPGLILTGTTPISANATSTASLIPASWASAGAYRDDVRHARRLLVVFGVASIVGGILGAILLLSTPPRLFKLLVPWLLISATVIFTISRPVLARYRARRPAGADAFSPARLAGFAAVWFLIAIYGGYFGGGMGFLQLATLAAFGMTDIHAMNGLKVVLGGTLNTMALIYFAIRNVVVWQLAIPMAVGGIIGGWSGARLAKRVDPEWVRRLVIGLGFVISTYFFWQTYGVGA
ncbi:MAG: sulfite exporter TauE/SafE family protein [Thermoplasmatota archaeon]